MNEKMQAYYRMWTEIIEDPYRPTYHFRGAFGFGTPFDPNGLLYWIDRYHMFYIFQDDQDHHCWGHASTLDFVHWKMHKPAMMPDSPLAGERIYSGNVFVNKEGVVTAIYCGFNLGVCVATSTDENLENWTYCESNPVIPIPDKDAQTYSIYNLYDADTWIEDGKYHNLVGGAVRREDARYDTAYLYTSDDLVKWDLQGEFYRPQAGWTLPGEDCACPDFFKLDDRYVMICISHMHGARAYIGEYKDGRLVPENHYRINSQGGCLFAPESMVDQQGNRLLMMWATDSNLTDNVMTRHSTCMALPRTVHIHNRNQLAFKPIEALHSLEYAHCALEKVQKENCSGFLPKAFDGSTKRIRVELNAKDAGITGIKVLCSGDGTEETYVYVEWEKRTLNIDFAKARVDEVPYKGTKTNIMLDSDKEGLYTGEITCQTRLLNDSDAKKVVLDLYLDRSILEVFADDGTAMAQRVYPAQKDSVHCALTGDAADFGTVEAWNMDAAILM